VTAAAAVGLALIAGIIGTAWGLIQAANDRLEARLAQEREEEERLKHEQERQQAKVRAALEKAFLAAMGADFDTAGAAAIEAERAGASTGEVRMLRGLIALYRGEPGDLATAVKELQLAADLLPDRPAPRGLLALTYLSNGDLAAQERVFAELDRLPAVTWDDLLFKGLGLSVVDAEKAKPVLDEAVRQRTTVVGRMVRADALASYLQQVEPTVAGADEACRDALAARTLLTDNAAALRISLRAHLVAWRVYTDAEQPDQAADARRQAEKDFRDLDRFGRVPDVANIRYYFAREVTPGEALAESERYHADCADPQVAANHAHQLYLHGDYAKAAEVMEKTDGAFPMDWVRLLATAELPDKGPARAYDLYRKMAAKHLTAWEVYNGLLALAALGRWDEVESRAGDFLRRHEPLPPLRGRQFERLVAFLAGKVGEDQFLKTPGFNRGDLSNAHLSIGLRRLNRGDRAGAREHFEKAVALRVIDFVPYDISTLLLRRIDDPKWPAWTPAKGP
jgi:Flp pilus assembly protein TadD